MKSLAFAIAPIIIFQEYILTVNYPTLLKSDIDIWNQYRQRHPKTPCSLAEQDLSQGYFFEGNFRNVDLQGANLRRACLIGADLQGANLTGADLRDAYLDDANVRGANLSHADLTGAHIARVDLQQATLTGALLAVSQDKTESPPPQKPDAPPQHHPPRSIADLLGPLIYRLIQHPAIGLGAIALGLALVTMGKVTTTAITPMGKLIPADPGQPLTVIPPAQLALAKSFEGNGQVWAVATHTDPNGRSLLVGGKDNGQIEIWDRETGENLRTLVGHNDTVRTLAVSASGHWLISGSGDGLKVWRLETGELIYTLPTNRQSPIWSVAISPDERTLVSSDYDGNMTVWDFSAGQARYTISLGVPVWSVKIAPDGQSFISGSSDRIVRQWDLATGTLLKRFTGHGDAVRSVAISPDGKTLASGSWDQTIKLWDMATGHLHTTLSGHDDRVVTLAISPDGKTLASGSIDNTLKLWDLPSQQLTKTLDSNVNWILAVAFDSLEQTLISSGKDQPVKVWQ